MATGKSNKESCNNSHYCTLLSPLLLSEYLRGSRCDEQLSRLLFNRQATSLATAVVDFLFAPKAWAKIACSSCNPPHPPRCIHSISMKSALLFSYQPMQSMTSTHIPVFCFFVSLFQRRDTWAARDPAVLYEQQYRNNWSTLQRSGGGRRNNGCKEAEAKMSYSGWHLAAAVRRAGKAPPGPVTVGTSGAHGELKMLSSTTHPPRVWATTSKEKDPVWLRLSGWFPSCSGFTRISHVHLCSFFLILLHCFPPGQAPLPLWDQLFCALLFVSNP